MQWIKVESKLWQQDQTARRDDARRDQHGAALRDKEAVKSPKRCIADRCWLAGQAQHSKQRRQQRDAGDERDDHARSGDQAQFRYASVLGWQKCIKTSRGRRGGECQWGADLLPGFSKRGVQIIVQVTLFAITDTELDTK